MHTVNENGESLEMASKESGLEVNADKSKYMVLYRDLTFSLVQTPY